MTFVDLYPIDIFISYFSEKIKLDSSCESSAADDSHEMSSLIFQENCFYRILSAAFVIGTLRTIKAPQA